MDGLSGGCCSLRKGLGVFWVLEVRGKVGDLIRISAVSPEDSVTGILNTQSLAALPKCHLKKVKSFAQVSAGRMSLLGTRAGHRGGSSEWGTSGEMCEVLASHNQPLLLHQG